MFIFKVKSNHLIQKIMTFKTMKKMLISVNIKRQTLISLY